MDWEEYLRKCSNMKCQRVQVDESYAPSLQDDEMEVEHLHAEPRNEHGSVDGNLASHIALNDKDDLELEVLDGFLDDVEIGDLEGTVGFSDACGGYFLDFDFATEVEVLGSGAYEDSLLENSNSESHSPGCSASSTVGGISDSTNVPNNTQSKCKNDSLDETVTYDTHGVRNNPSQPSNIDCMYNISLDIQHLHELNNGHSLAGGMLSCKKENVTGELCQPVPSREKRFRKPTQRYIEESSNAKSKEKVPTTGAKCKRRSLSSCNELHVRVKGLKKIPREKSSNGNSDVMLSELQRCKKNPKKEKLEYGNEPSSLEEFEDECLAPKRRRTKDRRKQQRMWTIAEVTKLVDGISEYGVGRWTDIQRFLFSSSYRTPTDIRDKWRNLLRASSAQKFNKKEGEQNDKNAPRLLPFSVASRVLELAKVHPYPRRSKKSPDSQVGSSVVASESKDSSAISFGRRNVRRKKCT